MHADDTVPSYTGKFASNSQMEEEIFAYWYFFYQRGGGTFLEMGGLDGALYSNTLVFQETMGWVLPRPAAEVPNCATGDCVNHAFPFLIKWMDRGKATHTKKILQR